MKSGFIAVSVLLGIFSHAWAKTPDILQDVEAHYRMAKTIRMDVTKIIKLKLLEKERKSEGVVQFKHGGKLRWETEKPEHSLLIINKNTVWLVDYPADADEKVNVLKSTQPQKSQPHALLTFLMGQGHLSTEFTVTGEEKAGDEEMKIDLKPKADRDQVQWLTLYVNKAKKTIDRIAFEDTVSNVTNLIFDNINFDVSISDQVFKFKPPKGADVTTIDR